MAPSRENDRLTDEAVLEPDDLDFTKEEEVAELDESRFVIGADGKPDIENADAAVSSTPSEDSREDRSGEPSTEEETLTGDQVREEAMTGRQEEVSRSPKKLTGSDVKHWISSNLQQTDSQYAYRLAAKTGSEISHQQLASDDIGMAFDGLLMWYAQQVGQGTAVEDTLGILLAESNIRVRFPIGGVLAYLDEHDLSTEDSIADLLEVIREHEGLVFPRGTRR